AEILAQEGIDAAVINARFVKPLDEETILSYAQKTRKLVTIEDHVCQGGFGSAVLELLAQKGVTGCRLAAMGYGDRFIEHGSREYLLEKNRLTAAGIVETARNLLDLPEGQEKVCRGPERGEGHG
ncbi:MAG TPA: 1-deoxy-D-xylulose-5-phosphate synthase, partial [Firmicutes bacterium]|nr:1-deoxy-D-xylulose-5-phosphate synthase [Bacillota bacterium]